MNEEIKFESEQKNSNVSIYLTVAGAIVFVISVLGTYVTVGLYGFIISVILSIVGLVFAKDLEDEGTRSTMKVLNIVNIILSVLIFVVGLILATIGVMSY